MSKPPSSPRGLVLERLGEADLVARVLCAQFSELQQHFMRSMTTLVSTLDRISGMLADLDVSGAKIEELTDALADLAFLQAQDRDLLWQMMQAIGQALSHLPNGVSLKQLASSYICDRQRRIHQSVLLDGTDAA